MGSCSDALLSGHEIVFIDGNFLAIDHFDDLIGDVGAAAVCFTHCAAVLGTGLDRSHQSPVIGDHAIVEGVDEFEHTFGWLVGWC